MKQDKEMIPELLYVKFFSAHVENKLGLSIEEFENPREHAKSIKKKLEKARELGINSILETIIKEKI